jgi:type IV secretory pathway protease TraF
MMGDNRIGSCDSRSWGPVSRSAFIGPVVATYWPPTRWTFR